MSQAFAESPVRFVLDRLDDRELVLAITDEILSGDHAYAERALPRDMLRDVVHDNVSAMLDALGGAPLDLAAATRTGRFKAEAGIPLAGVMHAYRIAGLRMWREIGDLLDGRDDAGDQFFDLGSRTWSILDQLSTAAAEAHRDVTDTRGRWDEQSRIAAVNDVFDGVTAPERREQAARTLGLTEPGRFLVVATGIDAGRIHRHDVPAAVLGAQWADRGDTRVGLLSLSATAAAPASWLPEQRPRTGVSREFALLTDAPEAVRQATLAMHCIPHGRSGTAVYGQLPVETLVVSQPQAAMEASAQILGALDELPGADRDLLLDTLAAWIESDGSTSRAGRVLHCHRNTVLYRLRRIQSLTGRSVAKPADVTALTVALLARRHFGGPDDRPGDHGPVTTG